MARKQTSPQDLPSEKDTRLASILEQRFLLNTKSGALLPLGISKSTSEISKMLINGPCEEQESIPREVLLATEKAQVKLSYMLNKDKNLESKYFFNAFDREVHDAVASIYSAGIRTFTTSMVMAVLVGKTNPSDHRPTKAQLERIEASIEKCMINRISMTFELSDEAMKLFVDMVDPGDKKGTVKLHQPLLNLTEGEFRISGAYCKAYQFVGAPALLQYARSRNMVQLLPTKLVAVPSSFKENSITIRGVLSQKILESYSSGKNSCIVLLSDIDKDYTTTYKQKKERIRGGVSTILDYWQQEEFIQSYAFCRSKPSKEFTYVSIELNDDYDAAKYVSDIPEKTGLHKSENRGE